LARLRPDELAVQRLGELCLPLPDVTERPTHGEPGFFVRDKKLFAMLDDHHHGADHLGFWCAAPPGAQEAYVADDPHHYYRPPYVGHRGWIGVRIDEVPDWAAIAEIVRDAYRQVAPEAVRARLDDPSA
jgi:hypothetical protein